MTVFVDFEGDDASPALPFLDLHGWCGDWRAMVPFANALPEHAHRLADLSGHGKSGLPADGLAALSIHRQAEEMLAIAPAAPFVVAGHSMGALVALQMAATAPERVAGAVLLDPAFLLPTEAVRRYGLRLQEKIEQYPPADIIHAFVHRQFRGPVPRALRSAVAERMASAPAEVARRAWAGMLAFDGGAALAALRVPALMVATAEHADSLLRVAEKSARVMTAQVAGSGHMLQYDVPGQIREMVRRWLVVAQVGAPAGADDPGQ